MSKKVIPQSAVIPFQVKDGKVFVLLVTTSGGSRWIIPKGMLEKGMTAAQSARKEAHEEAGASGKVYSDCLGVYAGRKSGQQCEIAVFPLRVIKTQSHWKEEGSRKRLWLPASKAAKKVKQRELAAIIARFPHWVRENTKLLNSK